MGGVEPPPGTDKTIHPHGRIDDVAFQVGFRLRYQQIILAQKGKISYDFPAQKANFFLGFLFHKGKYPRIFPVQKVNYQPLKELAFYDESPFEPFISDLKDGAFWVVACKMKTHNHISTR